MFHNLSASSGMKKEDLTVEGAAWFYLRHHNLPPFLILEAVLHLFLKKEWSGGCKISLERWEGFLSHGTKAL